MENFDQKPIFRCLICNGHFGTLEENEYGLWGHIIDPEEAEQAARAAEQNGMQSGSNTEMILKVDLQFYIRECKSAL